MFRARVSGLAVFEAGHIWTSKRVGIGILGNGALNCMSWSITGTETAADGIYTIGPSGKWTNARHTAMTIDAIATHEYSFPDFLNKRGQGSKDVLLPLVRHKGGT